MSGIRITGAGAGTGKTYYLTHELAEAVRDGLDPAAIIATTFTRKAAGELRERIRRLLIESGRGADAQRIFEGYIGTVHSVCARLLSEYAIDAGLSPAVEVLPEGEDTRFFRIAVAELAELYADELEPVAERLELTESGSGYGRQPDWRSELKDIVELARANAIAPDALRASGRRSADELSRVLRGGAADNLAEAGGSSGGGDDGGGSGEDAGSPGAGERGDGARRDDAGEAGGTMAARVAEAAAAALATLQAIEKPKGKTTKATELLERFVRRHSAGDSIPWSEYARLSKQTVNKDAEGLLDTVNAVAAEFVHSTEFHRDLQTMTRGVMNCAADALDAFAEYKRAQGVMDYTDLETRVLQLARENERVRAGIAESRPRIFVDEFQDTSPVQLALFLALHDLWGNSLWVGDPKQAIYGFRGTDPALMSAAVERLGTHATLTHSWRSRAELVRFSNAVFGAVLTARGYQAVSLDIPAERAAEAAGGRIETWYLRSTNQADDAAATAYGVARLLAERGDLRPGEIAVLCRRNEECARIAGCLGRLGVDASVGHGTLLQTAECRLAMAALRFLADDNDTLALAEIVHTHPEHSAHGAWLQTLIDSPAKTKERWRADPLLKRLEEARGGIARLAPDEALERSIALQDLPRLIAGWPQSERRRANLDTLRGVCAEYLAACDARRSAATVPGFIRYCGEQAPEQATGTGDDTVQVLTYHGAKGLEWRVVVLTSLDSETRTGSRTAFGASVESPPAIDLDDPLAGRAVRYWPWPFGAQKKIDGIDEAIQASSRYRQALETSRDESLRLLYVGITRARDELVLAARRKHTGEVQAAWVEELAGAGGRPVLQWPRPDEDSPAGSRAPLRAGDQSFDTLTRVLDPEPAPESPARSAVRKPAARYLQPACDTPVEHPPAYLSPSSLVSMTAAPGEADAAGDAPGATLFADLGERIPLAGGSAGPGSAADPSREHPSSAGSGSGGVNETALGNALHAVYAAAYPGISEDRLLRTTERLLDAYGLGHAVAPPNVVLTYRRLTEFLSSSYEVTRLHREWPISLRLENGSRAEGWVDLLVETAQGCVILDHKSFAGPDAARRVAGFAPQLRLYRDALEAAGAGPVVATLIHLPVLGKVYHVQ